MSTVIDVWSDVHCPWALVAVHRLRVARERHGLDVVFAPRAWPLEWVNRHGTPRAIVTTETAALASHVPGLFTAYTDDSWPSTFLPAFELVAATRRTHGVRAAEDVDYALRLAFFRDSIDVSVKAGLEAALSIARGFGPVVDADTVIREWTSSNPRADVYADFTQSASLPIQGSPQIFWPDGTTTHNPGMTEHHWEGGLVRIGTVDENAAERMLLTKLAVPPGARG
ncbi:hypothetical protein BayCH28_09585 [Mycolicibacterium sp. CH28]|uniref:DsbA family oxidoreductase n=1 Tax=Mycolicibacterium sp. CH28 TaxID=2512237 RepID=UPI0010813FA8|nr:DsbA family protein [Mycolicibacterium sp. CH28]TGD88035.1 hypothetical protein BayCH28_09585 [Mycolicibacterium sp. CH28]